MLKGILLSFSFWCTMYEQGGGNGIVRGLGYIYKWQRCDNETPKWKWFGKMIDLYFCERPRYGSFWIIGFKTPKTKVDNIQTMNLPIEEIAKQFRVGLKAQNKDHIVLVNMMEQSKIFFPLITITKAWFFCYKIVIKVILESLLVE